MTDRERTPEPVDVAPETPLDQTTPPIDHLQEDLVDEVPLDQTRAEVREVLGSRDGGDDETHHRD